MSDTLNKTRILFDPYSEPYSALCCPACGTNFLHHISVASFDRHEDEDCVMVTTITASEPSPVYSGGTQGVTYPSIRSERRPNKGSGNPSSRRHGIAIHFECEICHADPLSLTIAQHKGETYLEWDYTPYTPKSRDNK